MKRQTVYILLVTKGHHNAVAHCEVFSEQPTLDLHEVLNEHVGDDPGQAQLIIAGVDGGDSMILEEA